MKKKVSIYGEIIRDLRNTVGMNQTELAEKVGINASRISQYENGWCDPSVGTFVKILSALGYMMLIRKKEDVNVTKKG